jgi:hypothetical protein
MVILLIDMGSHKYKTGEDCIFLAISGVLMDLAVTGDPSALP